MTTQLQHPDLHPQTAPATQYPADIAQFTLLTARNRSNYRAPHYFGSVKIEGKWYQISTWITYSRNGGEQQLSNSVRPSTPEEAARNEQRENDFLARRSVANNPLHAGQPQHQQWGQAAPPQPTAGAPAANPLDHTAPAPATVQDKPPF